VRAVIAAIALRGGTLPVRYRLGRWPTVAIVTALALVAVGVALVAFHTQQQSSPRPALVKLAGAAGLGLRVAQVNDVAGPVGPVTDESAVYHISPDGPLPRRVTVQIPLRQMVAPGRWPQVFVLTKEMPAGRWQPLVTRVVGHGRYASVTVDRLSWFSAVLIDPAKLLNSLEEFFKELTSGAYNNAAPPSCDHKAAALGDRYSFATAGTAMLACFGMTSGDGRIVRLVDARRYPLLVNTHMPEVTGGGGDIFQRIGQLLSPDGDVVYPQGEADFKATIPDSASSVTLAARADLASEGQLLSSLSVGIDALTTIVDTLGKVAVSARVKILKKLLEVQNCRNSTDAEQLIANCFTLSELTGSFGDVLGAILAPVVTVSSLFTYFRGALNGIFDQFNNRSKFVAVVQRAAAPVQVYLRTTPTQGFQAGFRLYKPPCQAAEDCPLALVTPANSGTTSLTALTGTQWSSWTSTEATGTGTLIIGTSTGSTSIPVQVVLTRPVQACGNYYWSTAELSTLTGNPPPSGHQEFFNTALSIGNINDQPCPT
jgi:hypothetical protein